MRHSRNNRLPRILVHTHSKSGIFLGQSLQGFGHLVVIGLGSGLDGHRDHRRWESDRLQNDGV